MCELRLSSLVTRTLSVFTVLVFTAAIALAQVTTGSLQGVVLDPNNAAVAGATVRITNTETGITREATTNEEGFYRVTNLNPGQAYRVEVTAAGFAPRALENVAVRVATENVADVQVGIQGVGESVEVTGETTLIDSAQSQLTTNYTPQQLTQLPYVGSIDNLALLTPGVVTPGDADFTNGVGISANGNRGRSNNFQIDGQDNNDNSVAGPTLTINNAEAIGDYQVITNSFSAEFGRNSGAQINVVTRSGTNDFHGAFFQFHRNSSLNARDNIEKVQQKKFQFLSDNGFSQFDAEAARYADPEPFRENRFGFRLGGPIVKNKAFFFVTYEGNYFRGEFGTENLTSASMIPNIDSTNFLATRFNNASSAALSSTAVAGGPLFAQGVGTAFIVPPTIDTTGDGVPDTFQFGPGNPFGQPTTPGFLAPIAIVSCATCPGGTRTIFGGELYRVLPSNSTEHQIITREDINLTDKDNLVIRYIYDNDDFPIATGRFLAGAVFDVPSTNNNLGVTYTRTISSRFVNEARFNFSRLNVAFGDTSSLPGPEVSFSTSPRDIFFNLGLTFGTQNNLPQSRKVDVYQWQDTVSATLGNHGLKFGADIRHQRVDNFFLPNFLGRFNFRPGGAVPANTFFDPAFDDDGFYVDPFQPGLPREEGSQGFVTATAFENFLLGRPAIINFAAGDPRFLTTQNDFFFFLQDDWKIRPTLTLNLGARYEVSTTPFNPIIEDLLERESDPATALFDPSFPLEARTFPKLPIDKNNFAPRVGFAWAPNFNFLGDRFREGRTVVRGGFGVAYDPSFFNIVLNTVTAAPFAGAGQIDQRAAINAGTPIVAFPNVPSTRAQLNATPGTNGGDPRLFNQTRVDPNFHNPYTMSYNFGVQQELFRNGVLEVRYVGSRIVGQFQTINGNPDVRFLNRAAQCLGLNPGTFSAGNIVGTPAATAAAACANGATGGGFNNRAGTNANGRLDPNFGPVRMRTNGATSTYNGLQMRFDTRFGNSLVANVNYTLSKTIDNSSEIFGTLGGGQGVASPQNPFDGSRGERGLSAFHQKHNFTTNFLWELPFMREQRGFAGHVLGGWQLAGIVRAGSGRPYTPLQVLAFTDLGFENAFTNGLLRPFLGNPDAPEGTIAFGNGAARALFGDTTATAGRFVLYNTRNPGSAGRAVSASEALSQARLIYNDFGLASQGLSFNALEAFNLFRRPFGDVGRNTFTGEPFYLVNASVFKTTNLTEQLKVEFRVEALNLFNHRNFGVPDPITEDVTNGFAVSSFQNPGFNNGGNRTLRFGLRFLF